MPAAHIVRALLIVLAATLTAQNSSTGRVVVTVLDPTGAVIPGAHVKIIRLPSGAPNNGDWLNYTYHASEQSSADTDGSGEATVRLAKGSYAGAISLRRDSIDIPKR